MAEGGLPWYKEGLCFECTECGKCCSGPSGYVWVTEEEIKEMAKFLKMTEELFRRKFVRQRQNRYALVERKSLDGQYDCIFLKEKKCTIYEARPRQCRTFPWWKENLQSEQSWKVAAQSCEGIHDDAPRFTLEEIERQL